MSGTDRDEDANARELEGRGAGEDEGGIVDGEPDGGTDANYSAPPAKMKSARAPRRLLREIQSRAEAGPREA